VKYENFYLIEFLQAFNTIISNAVQVAVINGVGDFILFLGKCFVTAATGSIGLLFMRQDPRLHFYAVPIFITCIFAFFISHCVISLYEVRRFSNSI
jgi:solute carrier family 44 protein 1 (choline transporter-like protein)